MKKGFILILYVLLNAAVYSQTNSQICSPELRAKEGSFEIISHSKLQEVFIIDILCQIESRRDQDNVIDWEVSEMTTIRILPRKQLEIEKTN